MTISLAIIAGTGTLELFESEGGQPQTTPFGPPSARPERIRVDGRAAWFMARHGKPHHIPPHKVNYRANLHALKTLGVRQVIAIHAVGAVDPDLAAGDLVLPDQLIDYTWGRAHTYSEGGSSTLNHVEFGQPFAGRVRDALLEGAGVAGVTVVDGGCYGVTQGPRLETAAEIGRLARDGCSVVGMTAMPEAALARELGLDYASLSVVANPAAGLEEAPISIEDIHRVLASAMAEAARVIGCTLPLLERTTET